jgi:membrane-bound lytic murein transglycosylase D
MRRHTRNFWDLCTFRKALPRETANYIPKFIAAVEIAKDPAKYGFDNLDNHPEFEFETVVIEKPISLELLANNLNVPYEDMKKMNPRYKSDYVPLYNDRQNAVRVPVGRVQDALAVLDKSSSDAPRRYIASFEYYKVRRGDTLGGIARKFRTSVARLRDLNDWTGRRTMIRQGQSIKIPDGVIASDREARRKGKQTGSSINGGDSSQIRKIEKEDDSDSAKTSVVSNKPSSGFHVVKKGENLTSIAAQHGMSLGDFLALNKLNPKSKLFVGKKLKIAGMSNPAAVAIPAKTAKAGRGLSKVAKVTPRKHVVKPGENLSTISRIYDVSIADITKANALTSRAKLFVGRSLIIPE